jgi:hypothetical protein
MVEILPHGWVIARELAEKTKARRRLHWPKLNAAVRGYASYTPGSERESEVKQVPALRWFSPGYGQVGWLQPVKVDPAMGGYVPV